MASLRILLAEDNPVNRQVALRMLQRLGYQADIATNGREALDAQQKQSYDVILMDIMMPEMDGLEATRHIRATPAPDRQPRIIAVTANAMSADRSRCLSAGMDDYIAKPYRVETLADALSQCIADKSTFLEDMPTSAITAIDRAVLDELGESLGGDPDFLLELIEDFLKDARSLIDKIRDAVELKDAASLQHAAHTLKSNSAMFGAMALSATCKTLEDMGRASTTEGAEQHYTVTENLFEQVSQELLNAYA